MNDFFKTIDPSLTRIVTTPSNVSENVFKTATTTFPERHLTINELEEAFNKSAGADEISLKWSKIVSEN